MSSDKIRERSKTRERVQKFGELLKTPFRHNRSKSLSASPISILRPASPDTAILSNVIAGSSASTLAGLVHATEDQSLDPQPPTSSVLVKNEAFQKAIQEYIDNLSDDDKVAFQSATDVMEKLGDLQQSNSRNSSSHSTCTRKVQKVLQCMKQFLGSTAICIQHHPEITSLVVGGLNCILTVSTLTQFNFPIFIVAN